jgi:hypothetical protein
MIDPTEPLSTNEKLVFGVNAKRHPVLGFVVEEGSGAKPIAQQAENYIRTLKPAEQQAARAALQAEAESAP